MPDNSDVTPAPDANALNLRWAAIHDRLRARQGTQKFADPQGAIASLAGMVADLMVLMKDMEGAKLQLLMDVFTKSER